ncbi:hypothetical protein FRC10_009067 [Ceratobasidium sp. 414]|nr:hypothetical protein FRC10_009067 [Ceratobasidium sp. 414]
MLHTDNNTEQTTHGIGSAPNQEALNMSDNPVTEVAAAGVVAQVEPAAQGPTFQPESAPHEQGEVIPDLISPHAPLLGPGHIASAPLVLSALALAPAPALPVVPASNVDMNANLNPNPAQPTLLGALHGVGGIQFAENEVPGDLAAEVPALMPVANNNLAQQPLLRSLSGFEGIEFEDESEDESEDEDQ